VTFNFYDHKIKYRAGLAHMTKFVTSAESTELLIAVAETFSMPALVLAVTQLQSDSLTARQGSLVGSGFMFCSKN
jgi:hypothetical protein